MQKILLYYKFTPIKDPQAVRLWQKALTESLNLRGRILVSEHGLNGTVGGDVDDRFECGTYLQICIIFLDWH